MQVWILSNYDLLKLIFMHQSYLTFVKTNSSPWERFYDKPAIDVTACSLGKAECGWH